MCNYKQLRPCKFKEWDQKQREYKEYEKGLFHQWGQDFTEFDEGPGNFTVAIIERPDGKIVTIVPEHVIFTDKEER